MFTETPRFLVARCNATGRNSAMLPIFLPRSLLLGERTWQLSGLHSGCLFKSDVCTVGPAARFHSGRDKQTARRRTRKDTSLQRAADLGRKRETAGARILMFRLGRVQLGNPTMAVKRPSPLSCPLPPPCRWSQGSCADSDCKAVHAVSRATALPQLVYRHCTCFIPQAACRKCSPSVRLGALSLPHACLLASL